MSHQKYLHVYQDLIQPIQPYIGDLEIYQIQTSQMVKTNKLIDLASCILINDEINRAVWILNKDKDSVFLNLILQTKLISVIKYVDIPSIDELDKDREEAESNIYNQFKDQIFDFDRATSKLIAENFTNLRYYYIGSTLIDIYLVGQAKNGDWLTIDTSVVWA